MKAAFHTLGCKTNAYETQAIREQMEAAGWQTGEFTQPCDAYIINTCAVTREAARKSRQMIGRCRRLNPHALVVVTGCYAQEAGESLLTETGADLVVGTGEKNRILPMITRWLEERDQSSDLEGDDRQVCVRDMTFFREYEPQTITGQEHHVRVYVKIQDGCDRFCSYCMIPYLRGRARSRAPESVLQEAAELASRGCREIVLTGIDISSYSCQDSSGQGCYGLGDLLKDLGQVPGLERIRLGSLETGIVTRKFLDCAAAVPALCPQFHLSLQSGSDSVLKRMNRHYTTGQYLAAVSLIRTYYPEAGITTDIITGFPGETEEEFEETVRFTQEVGFSRIHVFPYSRRPGTKADRLSGQLSRAVKEDRTRRLIAVGRRLQEAYEQTWIGRRCEILAEECLNGQDEEGRPCVYLAGYTPEYVRIIAASEGTPEEICRQVGGLVSVTPTAFRDGVLLASHRKLR